MRVLVVYTHHNPASFTHAILEQVTRGLEDGGHDYRVNDLNAIGFDPVFRPQDGVQFAHESVPEELLEEMDPAGAIMELAGGPIRRFMAKRWLRDKSLSEIVKAIGEHKPKDVVEQQALVAEAAEKLTHERIRDYAAGTPTVYLPAHDPETAVRLAERRPIGAAREGAIA